MPNMMGVPAILRVAAMCVLLASPVNGVAQPRGVELDIAYAKEHPAQRLDLYLPAAAKNFSTVVFVHGGSLTSGDKGDEDYEKVCQAFVNAGLACASINYRLLKDGDWPASASDTAAAFVWALRNIAARGGDPKRIFLVGHSSGARLVATIATDESFAARAGFALSDIHGVVAMGSIMRDQEFEDEAAKAPPEKVKDLFTNDQFYRPYGSADKYRDSWPLHHIHAGMPPVLFIVAEQETIHPPVLASAEEFIAAAAKVGSHAEYKIVPGKHMDEVHNLGAAGNPILPAILRFIEDPSPR